MVEEEEEEEKKVFVFHGLSLSLSFSLTLVCSLKMFSRRTFPIKCARLNKDVR